MEKQRLIGSKLPQLGIKMRLANTRSALAPGRTRKSTKVLEEE